MNRVFSIFINVLYLGLIFYLCLNKPGGQTPSIPHFDKVLHFGIYFVLNFFLFLITRKTKIVFLFNLFIGSLIESIQYILPYRSFEVLDLLANTSGNIISLLLILKIPLLQKTLQKLNPEVR
ncbi:MAG: VanZ family protein [Bacteriovoracaceae bacterium]